MIQFLHVGKRFGADWAMVRFSLEVKPGELVWLGGPAGAGKSLALRLALGELRPTTGSITVGGVNSSKLGAAERAIWRRGISAVLDDEPPLELPARDWVALGAWCAGTAGPVATAAAREALERHGLLSLAARGVADCSRGQRLALALVRALLRRPHVLLVDWDGWTEAPLPESLRADLRAFVADGGTGLAAGGPGTLGEGWPGRRARIAPPEDQAASS